MQISGNPTWAAPQTTGHPLGLPAAAQNIVKDTQIASARAASDSALGQGQGKPFLPGLPLKPPVQGEPTVAPPSIMQIKISSLLQEQANARAEDTADSAEPARQENAQPAAPDAVAETAADKPPAALQEPVEQTEAVKGYSAALETTVAATGPRTVTLDLTDTTPVAS